MTGRNWRFLLQLAIFLPIQTILHAHNVGQPYNSPILLVLTDPMVPPPHPPLVLPHPREDSPPPPPGGWLPSDGEPHYHHTCTFSGSEIALQNERRQCQDCLAFTLIRDAASLCSESPTNYAKTGSPVEWMNITFVPGVKMVVLSSSISAKVSKMPCQGYKGYKWQCLTTQSPTQQHSEP